jgi:peptide/nickel transport system permease protein
MLDWVQTAPQSQAMLKGATPQQRTRAHQLARWIRRNPLLVAGAIALAILAICAIFAPWIAPYDPLKISPRESLLAPSRAHWFGTDRYGRDVLSRVIFGARNSLIVAIAAVTISATVGGVLGLIGGYRGGTVDIVIGRLMDIIFSFPALLLAIAIAAVLTPGVRNAVIAIAIVYVPLFSRIVRGPTIAESSQEYVEAARVTGAGSGRILVRHVAPNVLSPWIVQFSVSLSHALLLEAALGFLGLGVQPPAPSWGLMLSEASDFINDAPWLSIFPGLAIMLAVLAFNLVGDGLRDALDPAL